MNVVELDDVDIPPLKEYIDEAAIEDLTEKVILKIGREEQHAGLELSAKDKRITVK